MKIATWNLERPSQKSQARRKAQVNRMRHVRADVWVLTETCSSVALDGYQSAATPSSGGRFGPTESAAAIWVPTDWGMKPVASTFLWIVVEATPASSHRPLLVIGTIIPNHAERGLWGSRAQEAARQATEWTRLRREYPDHRFIVAGDLNMTLHSDVGYGCAAGRTAVRDGLVGAGLICATAVDIRESQHGGVSRGNIDHICIDGRSRIRCAPSAWFDRDLSDHNGIAVEVDWP